MSLFYFAKATLTHHPNEKYKINEVCSYFPYRYSITRDLDHSKLIQWFGPPC